MYSVPDTLYTICIVHCILSTQYVLCNKYFLHNMYTALDVLYKVCFVH